MISRVRVTGADVITAGFPSGGDWWDPNGDIGCELAAYQPKGAANLAASYVDLTGNGNNCGPGVAPTWDAVNGWKFDTPGQMLLTALSPAAGWSAMVSLLVASTGEATSGRAFDNGNLTFGIIPNNSGVNVAYAHGGVLGAPPPMAFGPSAVLGIAGATSYRNGISDGAIPAGGVTASNITIGNRITGGRTLDGTIHALAIYNCTLTAPQVLAVATAMALL